MGCRGLSGCSIIRASLTVALMVSLPRCGSLWAFGPSAHRAHASLRALPGFGADSRSLNRRGGRWPRPPLVSLPTFGRFALRATAHRADASLRCPKPCAAAQKSERCECPKGTRNAPRSNTLLSCMTHKRRGHPPPGGAAPLLFKKHYQLSLERPAFLASLRSLATLDGLCRRKRRRPPLIPASSRVSCVPVAQSFALP